MTVTDSDRIAAAVTSAAAALAPQAADTQQGIATLAGAIVLGEALTRSIDGWGEAILDALAENDPIVQQLRKLGQGKEPAAGWQRRVEARIAAQDGCCCSCHKPADPKPDGGK